MNFINVFNHLSFLRFYIPKPDWKLQIYFRLSATKSVTLKIKLKLKILNKTKLCHDETYPKPSLNDTVKNVRDSTTWFPYDKRHTPRDSLCIFVCCRKLYIDFYPILKTFFVSLFKVHTLVSSRNHYSLS